MLALKLAVCCLATELSFITSKHFPSVDCNSSLCHFVRIVFTVCRESLQTGYLLICVISSAKQLLIVEHVQLTVRTNESYEAKY